MLNSDVEWRDVVGFEGLYEVSSRGEVRATGKLHKSRKGKHMQANPTGTSDYLYVRLWQNNVMYNRSVHRLVAEAFVPNPDGKPMVNHLDGIKTHNYPSNLEWVTCSENHKHAYAAGLRNANHVADRNRGAKKAGASSKYHNVSYDKSRGKWQALIKDKGKRVAFGRFPTEEEAALYVNQSLDLLGLDNRPRNDIT